MPTGIEASSGIIAGIALPATATITFLGMKSGLLAGEGSHYSGEVFLNDLHVPTAVFDSVKSTEEICMNHAFNNTYYLKL
ncbi:hypothetical protein IZU94_11515 [Legionella sp. 27fs60]|nr:hypothetical protein [Legionella bononiensis]